MSQLDTQVAGQQVRDALAAVHDPELDRPITDLGFVAGVNIDGGRVHVRLRLPSFFGARRLAPHMIADVRAAVAVLRWVEWVDVCLAGRTVVPHDPDASGGPPAAVNDDLDAARERFRWSVYRARQAEVVRALLDAGLRRTELCALRLGDLPRVPEIAVYLQRRAELGLPAGPDAPLVVTEEGAPVMPEDIDDYVAAMHQRGADL